MLKKSLIVCCSLVLLFSCDNKENTKSTEEVVKKVETVDVSKEQPAPAETTKAVDAKTEIHTKEMKTPGVQVPVEAPTKDAAKTTEIHTKEMKTPGVQVPIEAPTKEQQH